MMKTVTFEELPKSAASSLILNGQQVEGHQAIYNPDNQHIYCIPTAEYQLVTHQQMIEKTELTLKPLLKSLGDFERTIRIDGEGERMRTTYRFPSVNVEIRKGDMVNPTVELFNSLDRSWKNSIIIGAFRLICTNGMTIGETFGKFKKRHLRSLDFEEAQSVLENGVEKIQQQAIEWKGWSNVQLSVKEVENTITALKLTNKEKELLMEEEEASTQLSIEDWMLFKELEMRPEMVERMNKWTFYNIITQFATHQINTELRRLQIQNAVTEIFYN
jgi:hypothetical protein